MRSIRDVMNLKVESLEFSVRCANCMKNMGIVTLKDLTKHSQTDFEKARNIGKKSIEEINGKLSELGLTYNMNDRLWLEWGLCHIQWIKTH